jgi:hypothetical protein
MGAAECSTVDPAADRLQDATLYGFTGLDPLGALSTETGEDLCACAIFQVLPSFWNTAVVRDTPSMLDTQNTPQASVPIED